MDWKLIKLGDAATFINGFAFKPKDWSTEGKEIIRIANLTGSNSNFNYFKGSINEKYLVKKGDLLISWSATLGVFEWEHETEGWLNQHIFKVVFDKIEYDKGFFKYQIESVLHELERAVHGSTMKHITKKRFDAVEIPLPPLKTQQKIVEILDAAAALRDHTKMLLEEYDLLAQSIFLDMFGDPTEGETVVLKESLKILGGYAFKSKDFVESGVPLIKIGSVNKGYFDLESFSFLPENYLLKYKKWVIKPMDMLISLTGTVGKQDYGNIELVTFDYDKYLLNQRVAKLEVNDQYNNTFFFHMFLQKK
ncbi:restriction endonuclease subunit S [Brumimicrobium salinarum]|uniref:Restriction endonuclease subunit S n=1 Tax=Brumimicrobium salinarum TaxID=2058658 RepID=A0A2I0R1B8_9FLAO|nr:restriction endonuclease subunit S [Brumimicrobium salinarum]PKR80373.1 restriction endonuclease subunit S [Brumimicrobium salinarum]